MISLSKIKEIFVTKAMPRQTEFWDTFSSFWHKSERLPQTQVLGLNDALNAKASKDDLASVTAGLIPMGEVENIAELNTKPKRNNDSYFVLDQLDENGDPYIFRYDAELAQWINTKQVVYKDILRKEDLDQVESKLQPDGTLKHPSVLYYLAGYDSSAGNINIGKIDLFKTSGYIKNKVGDKIKIKGAYSVSSYDENMQNRQVNIPYQPMQNDFVVFEFIRDGYFAINYEFSPSSVPENKIGNINEILVAFYPLGASVVEDKIGKDIITRNLGTSTDKIPSEIAVQDALPIRTASKNLLNISKILHGKYQASSVGGGINSAAGWGCIVISIADGLIPSEIFTLSGNKGRVGIGFYDVENPVETGAQCYRYSDMNLGTFTLDVTTKAICINIYSPQLPNYNNLQLEKGSVATEYAPNAQIVKSEVEGLAATETKATGALDMANEATKITSEFNKTVEPSTNKLDPNKYTHGIYLSPTDGVSPVAYAWLSMTDYMDISEGQYYTGINQNETEASPIRFSYFFDENFNYIADFLINGRHKGFTAPAAKYVRNAFYNGTSLANAGIYDMTLTGLFLGNNPTFEPFEAIATLEIKRAKPTFDKTDKEVATIQDIKNIVSNSGDDARLTFTLSGSSIVFDYPNVKITGLVKENRGYNGNSMFNFAGYNINGVYKANGDDTAPMHIMSTTIGANHGQPLMRGTIAGHGKDNTHIGTEWLHSNGIKYYIMRIMNSNEILFLSENFGTRTNFTFPSLKTGTLTRGGETMTITAVNSNQLYPAIKNLSLKVLSDGIKELTENGTYKANYVDIVESYDIMNVDDILNNIKARAGSSDAPIYEGESMVKVENIYRFLPNSTVLVITNILPQQEIVFQDFMFAQAYTIGDNAKYYLPNSLPNNGYDFRKPLYVNWSSAVPSMYFGAATWQDATNPINRVLQYNDATGFAIGFLKGFGVGKSLQDFTNRTFEIRNNTGKVYPHGVEGAKVGTTLNQGDIYNAVMYRTFIDKATERDGRMSYYNFNYNGVEYVYIDYSASMIDNIVLSENLNGKKIEVVEAANVILKSDVYNNGLYVKATYKEGETCFAVLKIY